MLRGNAGMLALARRVGFKVQRAPRDALTLRIERLVAPKDARPHLPSTPGISLAFAWLGWLAGRARA